MRASIIYTVVIHLMMTVEASILGVSCRGLHEAISDHTESMKSEPKNVFEAQLFTYWQQLALESSIMPLCIELDGVDKRFALANIDLNEMMWVIVDNMAVQKSFNELPDRTTDVLILMNRISKLLGETRKFT